MNQKHKGSDEERKKENEINSPVTSAGVSRIAFVAIAGIFLIFFGFGVILFYHFPSNLGSLYENLLLTALALGITGMILVAISVMLAVHIPSYKRIKQGGPFTVYDVMRMSLALPSWWKWWYPYVPIIVLIIGGSEGIFSGLVYWGLVLGYTVAWTLYLFLVSKRWLEDKNRSQKL